MTYQELQTIVAGEFNEGAQTLAVNPTDFGTFATDIQALFTNTLLTDSLAFSAVTKITDTGSAIIFQGTAPGIPAKIGSTPDSCKIIYSIANGNAQVVLAFGLPAEDNAAQFKTYFPKLADTFFDDIQIDAAASPYFIFTSYDHQESNLTQGQTISLTTGLNFNGAVLPNGIGFDIINLLFGTISSAAVNGAIQNFNYGPTITLDMEIPASLDSFFTQLSLPVTLTLLSEFQEGVNACKAGIEAAVTFDLGNQKSLKISSMLPFSGQKWTTIEGDFTNVALPGPAEMLKWIGGTGNDLVSLLPTSLSDGVSLDSVSLSITNTAPPAVAAVGFGVSTASGAGWDVIPGIMNVKNITADFTVYNPFNSATRKPNLILNGSASFPTGKPVVTFDLGAAFPAGSLSAVQSDTTPVDFIPLIGQFIPAVNSVTDVASLKIQNVSLGANIGATPVQYTFKGSVVGALAYNFGGTQNVAVAAMTVKVGNTGTNNAMEGELNGTASLLGFDLAANYNLNGSFMIDVTTPDLTVDLDAIASKIVGNTSVSTFSWLPVLTFSQTEFLIKHSTSGDTTNQLSLRTQLQINQLPPLMLFFEALQYQGTWGFVAGIDVQLNGLSSFPGLSGLAPFDEVFKLTEIGLVISSLTIGDFQFPGSENFTDPDLKTKVITVPAGTGGIQAGAYAFAKADLSLNKNTKMLQSYLKIDAQLAVSLFLGVNPLQNSKLIISLPKVTIDDNIAFKGSFGGGISGGEIMLFLDGTLTISGMGALTNNQDLAFSTTLVIVQNGAFISGTMQGILNFDVIKLENLALEVGINFEGIPSLGVAASIYAPALNNFQSSVAIFVDSASPQKSMVAGSISNTNLDQVVQATIGQLVTIPPEFDTVFEQVFVQGDPTQSFTIPASLSTSLDNQDLVPVGAAFAQNGQTLPNNQQQVHLVVSTPGQSWFITTFLPGSVIKHFQLTLKGSVIEVAYEAQFYLAPADTTIGTLSFPQGFFVSAQIGLFFLKLTTTISIDPKQGIAASGFIDKIVVFNENFFSLTDTTETTGPFFSLATYNQPNNPAGLQSPHFLLSSKLHLLGLKDDVYVKVASDGLEVIIDQKSLVAEYKLNGAFNSLTNFHLSGSISVGINQNLDLGVLGNYQFQAEVFGGASISFINNIATAEMNGGIGFMGQTLAFRVDLAVNFNGLGDIVSYVVNSITNTIIGYLKDAAKWLEAIGQKIITGIEETGQAIGSVLKDFYNLSGDVAASLLQQFGYSFQFIQDAINVFNNHGDVNMHIDNVYGSHIDDVFSPHQDTSQHQDTPAVHQDQNNPWGHIDNTTVQHIDSTFNHHDIPQIPHNDQPTQHQDQADHADNGKPKNQ